MQRIKSGKLFFCFLLVMVISLSILVVGETIVPSKEASTASLFELEGKGELTYSGITPYSRNQKEGNDIFAIKIRGPTVLNFSFELDLHPEEDYGKGIDIEYYEKTKNNTIKKVYLFDSLKKGYILHHDFLDNTSTYKNEGVIFSEGEYYLNLSDDKTYSSRYQMKIDYSCIEGFFNENKDYKCVEGNWVKYFRINVSDSKKPKEIPKSNQNTIYVCESGCVLENKCYPFGYRIQEKYCSANTIFKEQLLDSDFCENSFECKSGICADEKCLSATFIQKILNWFKNIF